MAKPRAKKIDPADIPSIANALVSKVKFPMLASMDGDQARLRPVSPLLTEGFTVYIGNLKSYSKTEEIRINNKVELCYLDDDHNQVRITAIAEIVQDRNTIEQIWIKNPLLKHYLGSVDNPELIVYKCIPNRVRFMQEWALEYHEIEI